MVIYSFLPLWPWLTMVDQAKSQVIDQHVLLSTIQQNIMSGCWLQNLTTFSTKFPDQTTRHLKIYTNYTIYILVLWSRYWQTYYLKVHQSFELLIKIFTNCRVKKWWVWLYMNCWLPDQKGHYIVCGPYHVTQKNMQVTIKKFNRVSNWILCYVCLSKRTCLPTIGTDIDTRVLYLICKIWNSPVLCHIFLQHWAIWLLFSRSSS